MAKPRKASVQKIGYGVLGLYAALVVLGALGVYGWTFTSVFTSSSDKIRAQVQSGRMLIATDDRVHCRSYTFDNATAQMTAGDLTTCESRQRGSGGGGGGSFGVIRDSFNNR